MANHETILEAKGIYKSFSGVPVLQDVRFEVRRGEVHALMGENGAGKSTLIKIITGVYTKDDGQIYWEGKPVEINNYQDCQKLGVACIYQELSVIPPLTVAQNVYLGREPKNAFGLIDYKKMNEMTQELINKYEFPLKPTTIVDNLGIGQRQLIEILKGLSQNSKLLIMDEPTASLSGKEAEMLFKIITTLREQNVSIIYISHRLEEVYRLSDRLTILRDGKNEAVLEKEEIVPAKVIKTMIGKEVDESAGSKKMLHSEDTEVRLDVQNLTDKADRFRNISFQVHRGEILGFGGLIGAGRTELVRAIYGVDHAESGTVILDGKTLDPSPKNSILAGIGFVPEDRRNQGFIPLLSTTKNVALTNYDILPKNGFSVSDAAELEMSKKAIADIDIRPADPEKQVGVMSGGNQQKVVLGKWLMRDLNLLIVDEPTAGIDVGAKDEIYRILEDLAKQGVAVIVVTSDLQELIRVSHRILVMRKGDIVKEFKNVEVTQSRVLAAGQGVAEEEEAS